ncbi:MAG: MFS transporter [Dehalococcoidia bacterium]|nr:MAG: MFS transporter [Dehalococcoidia bacterium]
MATETPVSGAPVGRHARPKLYYGYYIVGASLIAQLISTGAQNSVAGAFLRPMTHDLGWTRAQFTYGLTVSRFVAAGAGVFVGVWVDKYGGRRLMMAGSALFFISTWLTGSVTELWQWVVLRGFVLTIGASLVGNLVVNVTMSKWWVEKRGRMIGFAAMGVSLAGVVFPPLMSFLIEDFGWRMAWRILAFLCVALIIPTSLLMRRAPEDFGLHPDGRTPEEMQGRAGAVLAADFANSFTRKEALRTPALYLIVLSFGLGGVGLGTMLLQTIPFLTDQNFSLAQAASYSSLMSFFALISKAFWGWMTDRMAPNKLAAFAFVLSGFAISEIVYAAEAHSAIALVIGFSAVGWGFGGQIPLQETIWGSYFGRRYLGSVRSVAMPIALLIGAGAPLFVSWYYDAVGNYHGVFLGIGVLWFIAAGIVLLVRKPVKRPPVEAAAAA